MKVWQLLLITLLLSAVGGTMLNVPAKRLGDLCGILSALFLFLAVIEALEKDIF